MRKKRNTQLEFNFQASNLGITQEYFSKYERISRIIDDHPEIVDLLHNDLKKLLKKKDCNGRGRKCEFTSDTILRILLCQIIEGESLRGIVIRIDDSNYLRSFVRVYNGTMMDFTTLCTFKNAIRVKTWKKVNKLLGIAAVEEELIDGKRCRMDTTAYETNISWPSDSRLLWDTYRVHARLIEHARDLRSEIAAGRRLHPKRAKRLLSKIARQSRRKNASSEKLKCLYKPLIGLVEGILDLARCVCQEFREWMEEDSIGISFRLSIGNLIAKMEHFGGLGSRVVKQASRRVLEGKKVPNEEKVFSIFEEHTELLKRGKAGKPIEFGHMISLEQVEGNFITGYEVFRKKPVEHMLVEPALRRHRDLFGENPDEISADKGYYQSAEKIEELAADIPVVSIAKKGKRTEEQYLRETDEDFRLAQRFRAGIEGTISFLKRSLGMWRCMNKGWEHYVATVGATIFAHNLLVLARSYG